MNINTRSLSFVLIVVMLGIEALIQIGGLLNGNPFLVRQDVFQSFGLHVGSPIYAYITYAFIHAGLLHVGMNMFVMAQMGPPCEQMMGTPRFALFSLIAAVICGVGTYWVLTSLRGAERFVLVGYSGVIFAYIGYYVRIALSKRKNKQKFLINFAKRNWILLAFVFVPLLFPQLGISGEAHLIGAIFGFVIAPVFAPRAEPSEWA